MKKFPRLAIALFFALFAGTASASVTSYAFTGVVDSMFEYDGVTKAITFVDSSSLSGLALWKNESGNGSFMYDSSAELSPFYQPDPGVQGTWLMYQGKGASFLNFAGSGLSYSSDSNAPNWTVQVANNASAFRGWDIFSFHTNSAWSLTSFQMMSVNLFDANGQVFSGGDLPTELVLSNFHYAHVNYTWLRHSDGSQLHVGLRMDTLTSISSVAIPAPATSLLFLVGLFALGIGFAKESCRVSGASAKTTRRIGIMANDHRYI